MHIVLGATGHVGSACAHALLDQGRPVTAVVHAPGKAADLEARGARIAVADIRDPERLRAVFRQGLRAFLLNPPADPATDTDAEETATARAILAALDGAGLEKVVVESTMGAEPGDALPPGTGDSSVLYGLEQGLMALSSRTSPGGAPGPAVAVNRAAYYLSNFDLQLDEIRDTGKLRTMIPLDFPLPMVAPADLGRAAARRLTSGLDDIGVIAIEGPARHTLVQVADAFAEALGRPVEAVATPRDGWIEAFRAMGFSAPAAESYARMTAATLDRPLADAAQTEKGETTLRAYVHALVD